MEQGNWLQSSKPGRGLLAQIAINRELQLGQVTVLHSGRQECWSPLPPQGGLEQVHPTTDSLSPSAGRAAPVCVRTAPTDSKSCCCYSNSTQPACCTFLSADCILSSCKMPGASLLWEGGERVGFQSDWTTSCPSATWVWWEKAEWLSVVSYAP